VKLRIPQNAANANRRMDIELRRDFHISGSGKTALPAALAACGKQGLHKDCGMALWTSCTSLKTQEIKHALFS
jgi:hypothetical protein